MKGRTPAERDQEGLFSESLSLGMSIAVSTNFRKLKVE